MRRSLAEPTELDEERVFVSFIAALYY